MKLVLEKFSKSFGPVSVIENLDLTVHSGEMLALLGPSGCGKSTTLFSICGIYRMNSGKLLFDEKDMTNEILYSIKRAGADMIVTYFAKSFASSFQG